jgi:hypothetical protein
MHVPTLLTTLALPLLAAAHGCMLQVPGANGKTGTGLGTLGAKTTGHSTFYYAPRWLKSRPQDKICGGHRYKGGTTFYTVDWKSELAKQVKKGLPTTSGNTVTIKYFQVNRDGAGPMTCEVSADAKGSSWKTMKVTQNVPGDSAGESDLYQRYHTLKAQLPSGLKCTGSGGACLVRCKNPNVNSFGGCVVVKRGGSSARAKRDLIDGEEAPLGERDFDEPDVEERDELFVEPEFDDE